MFWRALKRKTPRANNVAFFMLVAAATLVARNPRAHGRSTRQDVSRPASSSNAASLTAADLDSFLGSFVPEQLARRSIAGAVVVIVRDGATVFARGYGLADIETGRPVVADETLIRPGSISKLFTALAVRQLVEKGVLDLDRDINDYLDFHVATPQGGVPVTLRLLLTHRAGFEDHVKDLFLAGTAPPPLGLWLATSQPVRLFPGGDVPAYSNYGYALAGYVVERKSGERFEEYMMRHILEPLGMSKATFEQPPVAPLAQSVSRGYVRADAPALLYFETIGPSPAGGLSATGADMGRFVAALLNGGGMSGRQVVQPLGFEDTYSAGNHFIGKHGLTNAVVSDLELLFEERFGLFVSYNSASAAGLPNEGGGAPAELLRALAGRYFTHEPTSLSRPETATADAAAVAGVYEASQRADSSFLRLKTLVQLIVTATPEGGIRIVGFPQTLHAVGPLEFEGTNDLHVRFAASNTGQGFTMSVSAVPLAMVWTRVPWHRDVRVVLSSLGVALIATVGTLIAWPIAALIRRRRKRVFGTSWSDRRDYFFVRAIVVLDLLVVLGMAGIATMDPTRLNRSFDLELLLIYVMAWVGVLSTPFVALVALRFWRHRDLGRGPRVHHILLGLSVAIFAWFFVTWRIAGTTLNY